MRRKLAGLALGLAAMAMLALSGCGAMTPEKLAGKIRQAVEKTPCSQMEMDMVVDMTMAEPTSGIEMDLGIRMAGQMQMSYDPDTAYENLEVTVEMMGIRMPANMEIYVLQEGGVNVSYTNVEGNWTRSELEDFQQTGESGSVAIWDLPAEQLSIDEEVTELEGAPAVCLNAEVTGEDVSQALGLLFNNLEGSLLDEEMLIGEDQGGIDWEQVTAQVATYTDPKTFLPIRQEITVSGLGEALSGLMGDEAFTLGIRNAEVTMDYTSYEPVEPCVLPEGAKEAAEQNQRLQEGNPDNGDGTFTIQERGYYVDVAAPEGYELESSGYDQVNFYNEELDRLVCYQMWITVDSNDLFFWDMVIEEEVNYTGSEDIGDPMSEFKVTDTGDFLFCGEGFTYDGACKGRNYYAWANLDDGFCSWILVKIYDGGNTVDSTITEEEIEGLLRQVSRHQQAAPSEETEAAPDQLEL